MITKITYHDGEEISLNRNLEDMDFHERADYLNLVFGIRKELSIEGNRVERSLIRQQEREESYRKGYEDGFRAAKDSHKASEIGGII